jgi:hypothetical protein
VRFESNVKMKLCSGAVCDLRVRDSRVSGGTRGVVERLIKLHATLKDRYGDPSETDTSIPKKCANSEELACLVDGTVKADYRWRFASGHKIRLRIRLVDQKPVLELRYQAPKAATGAAL